MKLFSLLFTCSVFLLFPLEANEENCFFLNLPDNQKVEMFLQKPPVATTQLLLFLHGAAASRGLQNFSQEWFDHWVSKGYMVAALSLPGYGQTTGVKDFCGPATLNVLSQAVTWLQESLGVEEFGIIGFGQGGVAGLLLTAQMEGIRCIVCTNGGYDLMRHLVAGDPLLALLQANYTCALTEEALKIRSPMEYIASLQTPTFILHREGNPIVQETEVFDFVHAMEQAGHTCGCVICPKGPSTDPQKISYEEVLAETEQWVDFHMHP